MKAENRLDNARLLFQLSPKNKNYIFLFTLQCDMYISKENRRKTNEFLLTTPDNSSVALWCKNSNGILNSEVITIKEHRTCSSTDDGYPGSYSTFVYNRIQKITACNGNRIRWLRTTIVYDTNTIIYDCHKRSMDTIVVNDARIRSFLLRGLCVFQNIH